MLCSKCGTAFRPNARFCARCGAPAPVVEPSAGKPAPKAPAAKPDRAAPGSAKEEGAKLIINMSESRESRPDSPSDAWFSQAGDL